MEKFVIATLHLQVSYLFRFAKATVAVYVSELSLYVLVSGVEEDSRALNGWDGNRG